MLTSSPSRPLPTAKALTFIIPVRHPDNAKDWTNLKNNLSQTVRSISAQTSDDWKAVIVANHGADLPALPEGFEVKWVDFSPNLLHEQGGADQEQWRDAFRRDKGRRVLAGMLHAGALGHVMIVDDDDFVSNKLAEFVAENKTKTGWYFSNGYAWQDRKRMLYCYSNFHHLCGTSHIIRSDLYGLPTRLEDATDLYIRRMLGSHIFIDEFLQSSGNALYPLPFVGAIYRIGHVGTHSKSGSLMSQVFRGQGLHKRPVELLRRLVRLRFLSGAVRKEFMG